MQDTAPLDTTRRRRILGGLMALTAMVGTACAEVGSAPDVPAAIEFARLPYPSVVIKDSLRNEDGVVTPIRAIVRNSSGEEITGAAVQYLYADYNRDSALLVDSSRGFVVAHKAIALGTGRLAARIGSNLQILANLVVTTAPDTASGSSPDTLSVSVPDSVRNTTGEFVASVRHRDTVGFSGVNGWLVRYQLVYPANATNDTSAVAYLVNSSNRPATVDTTDASGNAGLRVRVRGDRFPAGTAPDSVVVQVTVRYRGQPVKGSPLRLRAHIVRRVTVTP
ncbi:MAG TPA: hypothetical protein VGE27_12955 [Gemmatimonas sp.]|uniref:hypothetical protein n=1 Tax=Gemmatimonas sp. TaxID=1962908 RepID=UPI002EDAABC0